nr:hypothetical protein [Tanacetum cinerariifolium]
TRTPTQVSSISNQISNVLDSDVGAQSPRISLTPRPIGRRRATNSSTSSVTLISTIYNGKNLSEIFGQTATKESPSTGQVRVSSVQSSLLTSNSSKHKRQMIARQSAWRINFSEAVQKVDKKDKWHKFVGASKDYINHGDPTFECSSCGALLWYAESMRGATNASSDSYSLCCGRDNIRRYNSMFAFTSMGGKQDTSINMRQGPYCYCLHGENYHLVGPLLPETGKPEKFAQLYIFDTKNEIQNRISAVSNRESSSSKNDQLDYKLTTDIRDLLDEINPLVKDFHMAMAALIVGDFDSTEHKRDIILQCQVGDFKRIGVTDYDEQNKRTRMSMKQLSFNRKNNKDLRGETYSKLATLAQNKDSRVKLRGKKVVLNLAFTGSPWYTMQNYLDAMTLCKFYGYPDLFITFTCNPNWPEISRFIAKRFLKSEDRPDVISRVFKIKLDCLMKEIKDDHIFGRVQGVAYTIEFQKRGLSHCHILLWLKTQDKLTTTGKIDKYISSKIPNKDEDPELSTCHGSYNAWPLRGYAVNKRRNDGSTIKKSGTDLHNGYVVSYNPTLLRRYQAHINIEYCNQVGSIKYLFKYIKKGPDRVSETIDGKEVIFDATESIDYAVDKSSVNETKFEIWMELKKTNTFARSLLYVEIPRYYTVMAQDVLFVERIKLNKQDLKLSDIQRKNICLTYIECMLRTNNMSLKDIQNMPYPNQEYNMDGYNRLIFDKTLYDIDKLKEQHVKLNGSLTSEQKYIYFKVMNAVDNDKGGDIVLNVASSGIAALLLEGGRTVHSRFAIPINDEAPMVNRHCYETFNRTLRDICRTDTTVASDKVFGGKVVLFGGDFRQILHVITNGGRQDVVNVMINASYLWQKCTVLRLTVNMRLGSGATESEKKKSKNLLIGY